MLNAKYYIEIKNKQISVIVRNYKNTRNVKIFFRGNILNISKPKRLRKEEMTKIIKQNEEYIYNQYMKIILTENLNIKYWKNGEKISYLGEEFTIIREKSETKKIKIFLDPDEKQLKVYIPTEIEEDEIKGNIDSMVKQLFKNDTAKIIQQRLPYWSQKTGIEYQSYKIRDAISKYGSCIAAKKALYFSARLIMLPKDKIDAIIVHELCHIIHRNHSKEFYELVKRYIPNYDEIDKWLKKNNNLILI